MNEKWLLAGERENTEAGIKGRRLKDVLEFYFNSHVDILYN